MGKTKSSNYFMIKKVQIETNSEIILFLILKYFSSGVNKV